MTTIIWLIGYFILLTGSMYWFTQYLKVKRSSEGEIEKWKDLFFAVNAKIGQLKASLNTAADSSSAKCTVDSCSFNNSHKVTPTVVHERLSDRYDEMYEDGDSC